jgi:DNA-directed RNA polymerase subunit RPC12/RpoP
MTTVIANCLHCNRIFRKHENPLCPECHQAALAKFSHVYRFVQENPNSTLENIAEQCNVPLREVQTLFFQGKLGTATAQIIYHCLRCNRPLAANMRKGRFCMHCTEQFEAEAGLNDTEQPEKTNKRRIIKQKSTPKGDEPPPPPSLAEPVQNNEEPASLEESYGFNRLTSDSI